MATIYRLLPIAALIAMAVVSSTGCGDDEPTKPAVDTNTVRGKIIGGLGGPMKGVQVNVSGSFGNRSTTTNQQGMFSVAALPSGLASITTLRGADTARALVSVGSAEADSVVLRLAVWELAWSDEFNGTMVDESRWGIWNDSAGLNNELGYHSADEVSVVNGHLRMRAQRRSIANMEYSTGAVFTRAGQLYGRFEARARLPKTASLHAGYWMYPIDSVKPNFEIDIVEVLGASSNTAHFTYHYTTAQATTGKVGSAYSGPDFAADFHTFRLDWFPGELRWYVDGVQRFQTYVSVCDRAMLQVISTHVGGNWPGSPNATTVFPQYHDVDYVRVYRSIE